jgi:DUF1009 family protein
MRALSQFLPPDFDPQRPVALLAGQGNYPALIKAAVLGAGVPLRVVAFVDETQPEWLQDIPEEHVVWLHVGQLGKLLKALARWEAGYALLAGRITPGRLFKGLRPDWRALWLLARLPERNAQTLFGALAQTLAEAGVRTLDARSFLDEHVATPGLMTQGSWAIDPAHLAHGLRIARHVAAQDIGQSVVVAKGTVLAVEAFEGTNAMLRRAGAFEVAGSLLVKVAKPQQDMRLDVPVFGSQTLNVLAQTRIRHVALEATSTLILDKPQVLAQAQALGIALWGGAES